MGAWGRLTVGDGTRVEMARAAWQRLSGWSEDNHFGRGWC